MKKFNLVKKVLAMTAAIAMMLSVAEATSEEIAVGIDSSVLWSSFEELDFKIDAEDTGDVEFTLADDPSYFYDAVGYSAKVERLASGLVRICPTNILPKFDGKTLATLEFDIYSDGASGTLAYTGRIPDKDGSDTVTIDTNHGNIPYSHKTIAQNGDWQHICFDITNLTHLYNICWESTSAEGTLYIDNVILTYNDCPVDTAELVFDSFEGDWTNRWIAANSAFTVTENTDAEFVKDGSKSVKVTAASSTDDKDILISELNNMRHGNNAYYYNGRQFPIFEGYKLNNAGFWVYLVGDTSIKFNLNGGASGTGRETMVSGEGWHFCLFQFDPQTATYGNNLRDIRCKVVTPGTFYIDALSARYFATDDVVLDALEGTASTNWFREANGSIVYAEYNSNRNYVVQGSYSFGIHQPVGTKQYRYTDWKAGLPIAQDGKITKTLSIMVLGNGTPELSFKPRVFYGTLPENYTGAAVNHLTEDMSIEKVSLDFTGWKRIDFEIRADSYCLYGIEVTNTGTETQSFYIDYITAEYANEFEIISEQITDSSGNTADLTAVLTGEKLTYKVNFDKNNSAEYAMNLILAVYNNDGSLAQVKVQPVSIAKTDTGIIPKSAELTLDSNIDTTKLKEAKGFIWNGMNTMVPVK